MATFNPHDIVRAAQATAKAMTGGVQIAGAMYRFGDKLFKTRPEDFERKRQQENQRNRDIYFEMMTRRERQRRGL